MVFRPERETSIPHGLLAGTPCETNNVANHLTRGGVHDYLLFFLLTSRMTREGVHYYFVTITELRSCQFNNTLTVLRHVKLVQPKTLRGILGFSENIDIAKIG